MRYEELRKLKEKKNDIANICLFGAGLIGSTWAYDLLYAMGFHIDFYCDNGKKPGIEIKSGVKTISLEELYAMKENVLVFITVTDRYQQIIKEQLEKNGIYGTIRVDYSFLQIFIESILEMNDKHIGEKFKCILDDSEYISRQFEYNMKFPLNLEEPKSFNEKIQWLKLYDRNPDYVKMVDKYEVKKYVTETIGEEYIIPTLGVWNDFNEIDFDLLPDQFVLKCTHDSGSIYVVDNKTNFDRDEAGKLFKNYLNRNYYYPFREWPYFDVKPRIIAEPYLGKQLRDFKIYNFNGKAKMLHVDLDRYGNHTRNFYSTEWEYLDIMLLYPTNSQAKVEKPKQFEKMIELAETLSKGKAFVRTDFYNEDGKIYFGEMTFYPGTGYRKIMPEEIEYEVGSWIKLPSKKY